MMVSNDIRWQQRFHNYNKALQTLEDAVETGKTREFNNLEKQGVIQAFEFTFELAWKVMKDYLSYQGIIPITGAREAIREAFQNSLIVKGQIWMEMLESRNLTSHTYNEKTADDILELVLNRYFSLFIDFKVTMKAKLDADS